MRLFSPRIASQHLIWSAALCFGLISVTHSSDAEAEVIWSGGFETGDFMQWHKLDGSAPNFSQIPEYCRPFGYANGGDGSCLSLETDVVRQGNYAARFTVKNSENGSEPVDCDLNGNKCERRRTELTGQATHPIVYDAMPYMSERWMSVSHYLPNDWTLSNTGWGGIVVFQVKPLNENGLSPAISIALDGDSWRIWHRWDDAVNPSSSDVPWQQQMFYTADYPSSDGGDSGADLRGDFPDQTASQNALGSVNRGGWTDWVIHVKYDARGESEGGSGFLEVWKREDSGSWVKIINILPKRISRGDFTFDRGIGYNSPPTDGNNGGFGIKAGLYMSKDAVWNLSHNRVIINDNIKIADSNTTLEDMSPNSSSSAPVAPPAPPTALRVQ